MSHQTHNQGGLPRGNAKSTIAVVMVLCLFFCEAVVKGDWKADANARIEQIRKRDAQITVQDSNGRPISGIGVQIDQIKHRFAFGSCINYRVLDHPDYPYYDTFFQNHFEWAVCENESKWWWNEPSQGYVTYVYADDIYNWCNSNGITMRGHNIFWEQTSNLPSWVPGLSYAPWPQTSALYTACQNRINSVVPHFQGKFVHWDVDNEQVPTSSGYRFFDRLEVKVGDVNSRVWMYQRAHQLDPNCLLFMNEYSGNSFTYGSGYSATSYISCYNSLAAMGAPVQAFGIQGHINSPFDDTSAQYYWSNVLKPLGALGLPLWITEFDSDTTSDTQRATDLENFYRICFSDPNVYGILMWGFMTGTTWRNSGAWGLENSSGTLNAAGTKYESLMDEWTTSETNTTDSNGNANFRGFHGTYEITLSASPCEPNEIHTIELVPDTNNTTQLFTINTNLTGNIYDLNCDGSIDWGDVGVLAENWLVPNPQRGDFDGDGIVNLIDFAVFATAWQNK
jgi:GH35 family endo-1,4-beta-xylanase